MIAITDFQIIENRKTIKKLNKLKLLKIDCNKN